MLPLEDRVLQLETSVRRLRWGAAGLGILALSAAAIAVHQAMQFPEHVTARSFRVTDENGASKVFIGQTSGGGFVATTDRSNWTTATLGHLDEGGGCLRLKSKDGQEAIFLGAAEKGGVLTILAQGRPSVVLTSSAEGSAVGLISRDGKEVAGLGCDESGSTLWLSTGDKPTAVISSSGQLLLCSPKEAVGVVRVGSGRDGGFVELFAQPPNQAKARVTIGVDDQGRGEVGVWDPTGAGRTFTPAK